MKRKNQKIEPFEISHTIARVNNREFLLIAEVIELFKSLMFYILPKYGSAIYCYVAMTNHIHIMHQSPTKNPATRYGKRLERKNKIIEIGDLKRHLFSQFAKAANKILRVDKFGKVIHNLKNFKGPMKERFGCLIEDRSKSIPVRDVNHGLANLIYIFLNPVRAGIVRHPKDYEHSNYEMYATGVAAPGFSFHPEYLSLGNTLEEAAKVFKTLIGDALTEILKTFIKTQNQNFFKRECFSSNIQPVMLLVKKFFHLQL